VRVGDGETNVGLEAAENAAGGESFSSVCLHRKTNFFLNESEIYSYF